MFLAITSATLFPPINMTMSKLPVRTRLFGDPEGKFVHDVILDACRKFGSKTALIDTSCDPPRRITFADYGDLVERTARGLVRAGIRPGEKIGIFLPNCWEFGVAFHAATLAGAVVTTLNPTYREREVCYQLETSEAVALISDGPLLDALNLCGVTTLRHVFTVRTPGNGACETFDSLYRDALTAVLPRPEHDPRVSLATLPFSSGTTGLPKGSDALAPQHRCERISDAHAGGDGGYHPG